MSDAICNSSSTFDATFDHTSNDDGLVALYCACNATVMAIGCRGICANPDLAGVGVRAAFYAQSVMNALLVFFSRRDSISSAWAATCLVIALVIPAMVQKFADKDGPQITLHHATLVFNFATLSCISSLAVAPKLPIWRLEPVEYAFRELERQNVLEGVTISTPGSRSVSRPRSRSNSGYNTPIPIYFGSAEEYELQGGNREPSQGVMSIDDVQITKEGKKKIARRQARERFLLSMALLLQVILQWAWGVILFVSPEYSQDECSGQTSLWLFFRPFNTTEIQTKSDVRVESGVQTKSDVYHLHAVWPLWLLFCLFLTLFWTIMLACSGPSQAHDEQLLSRTNTSSSWSSRSSRRSNLEFLREPQGRWAVVSHYSRQIWGRIQMQARSVDRSKLLIVANYLAAFVLWVLFVVASELQIYKNPLFNGENDLMGFGQTAALLLALVPLWSLTVALYKYPARIRQKRMKKRRNAQLNYERQHADRGRRPTLDSTADHSDSSFINPVNHIRAGTDTPGMLRPPMVSAHGRTPSDLSVVSDTAPLIVDNIPRMDNTWRRMPWSYSDSNSDSDDD